MKGGPAGSAVGRPAGCCELGHKLWSSRKEGEFLNKMSDYQLFTKDCAPTELSTAELPVSITKPTAFRKIAMWIRRRNCNRHEFIWEGIQAEPNLRPKTGTEAQLITSLEAEWDVKARGPWRDKQKKYGVRILIRQCSALTEKRTPHQIRNKTKGTENVAMSWWER